MKDTNLLLNGALNALLNEKLSEREVESLKEEGFNLKNQKRSAAVMIALYKKAAAGDLSAIKELRSIAGDEQQPERSAKKAVIIIDDIESSNVTDSR
ncbi:MAG: hypothetical protein E7561_01885 [Ruminococcaceae bacterium]|nr:hypothetical protein [Oscillospiraceae bacterium]